MLTGERLFHGQSDGETVLQVLQRPVPPPSAMNPGVPAALDAVVLRGLSRDPHLRFDSANVMAGAVEEAARPASTREVAEWVKAVAGEGLALRRQRIAAMEGGTWSPTSKAEPRDLIPIHESTTVAASEVLASTPPRSSRLAVNLALLAALGSVGVFTAVRLGRAPDAAATATSADLVPSPTGVGRRRGADGASHGRARGPGSGGPPQRPGEGAGAAGRLGPGARGLFCGGASVLCCGASDAGSQAPHARRAGRLQPTVHPRRERLPRPEAAVHMRRALGSTFALCAPLRPGTGGRRPGAPGQAGLPRRLRSGAEAPASAPAVRGA